jgi:hypothetical protein
MSKYSPSVGDTGVIGQVDFITTNPLGRSGFFFFSVSANGYASAADNVVAVNFRYCAPVIPAGINNGDFVTATIAEENGVAYATNLEAL